MPPTKTTVEKPSACWSSCCLAVLPQQGQEQMDLLDLLMIVGQRQLLGALDGLQGFLGILLCIHDSFAPFRTAETA